MAKFKLIVLSNARLGEDVEFNDWYNNTHIHDVMEVKGFVAARRFERAVEVRSAGAPYKYLAIYEVETDDPAAAVSALEDASKSMVISDSMSDDTWATLFVPILNGAIEAEK